MAHYFPEHRSSTICDDALPANTLIIISGFSGSGKSTLIDHLVSGQLSADLADRFPEGCAGWPQLNAVDLRRGLRRIQPLDSPDAPPQGAILHYEINHHFQGRSRRPYETDPVFPILAEIPRIIVVVVRPTVSQLVEQFSDRARRKISQKGRWRELFRRSVKVPLQDLRGFIRRTPRQAYDVLYKDGDWLRACAASWDKFIRAWTQTLPYGTVICLRPSAGSWRIEEIKSSQLLPLNFESSPHVALSEH